LKLLKSPTSSELIFKKRLDEIGIKHNFQKGFIAGNNFCIADFYLPKPYKIIIEIDGDYHKSDKQIQRDKNKDSYYKIIIDKIKNADYWLVSSLIGDLDVPANQRVALEAAISFALAECGAKIGLKHQVQRNLYRSTFKRVEDDPEERIDYLEHLITAIDFHANAFNSQNWTEPKLPQGKLHSLGEETKVCLSFLNKLKHTIVIPILTRFWINYERSIGTPAEQFMRT
jgi:hypothetical protein